MTMMSFPSFFLLKLTTKQLYLKIVEYPFLKKIIFKRRGKMLTSPTKKGYPIKRRDSLRVNSKTKVQDIRVQRKHLSLRLPVRSVISEQTL